MHPFPAHETRPRRRVWSELVPLEVLARHPVLEALARRRIELLVAVRPSESEQALDVVASARERGVSVGLWPMLDDARGRWLNPDNAPEVERHVAALCAGMDARGLTVDAFALDLEPPIDEVRRVSDGRLGAARAWLSREASDAPHRRLVTALRERGVEVVAAVIPSVLAAGRAGRGWQRALGSSLDVDYDVVTAMLYTSLFEGYSFGAVSRADARALLGSFASLARRRLGVRAAVSLGAVGVGALGDERTYRDATELADDVAIARAAGVTDLALFDLAGVLSRPPIEPWLDAFTATEAAASVPPATPRARAVTAGLWVTGVALDAASRPARR